MNKCEWPTCDRIQKEKYCFPHSRLFKTPSSETPAEELSLQDLLIKAQKSFNTFIRDRDRVKGCITCGGQVTEAGHYIPVGENSALRFTETNAWGQCSLCNGPKGGNRTIYRAVLISTVGLEEVLRLENFPRFHKFSRPQLLNIISTYSTVLK